MQEVRFYQYTQSPLIKVLKELLEKSLGRGQRSVVLASSTDEVESLCTSLWTTEQRSFIPHGSKIDGNPSRQPIWFTEKIENPNQASILVSIGDHHIIANDFNLLIHLIDGNNTDEVQKSISLFEQLRQRDLLIKYYFQNETGKWIEKTPPSTLGN